MTTCNCGRGFHDYSALAQHQRDKGHYYCQSCKRCFRTADGLEQHTLALHTWNCGHCDRVFRAQEHLTSHQRVTGHCYCIDCNRFFIHNEALNQHLQSSLHISQFHCCDCDRDFANEHALQQHLENKIHHTTRRQTSAHLCDECIREFGTKQALEQHKTSLVHRPLSDIKCITSVGRLGCKRRFSSPSALLHHLESGVCQSGVTRRTLNAVVQMNDTAAIITNTNSEIDTMSLESASQISGSSGAYTPTTNSHGGVELTPSSTTLSASSPLLTPSSEHSGPLSCKLFSFLKCPLCPSNRAAFSSSESLRQHICSPAHATRIFHCPTSLFSQLPSKSAAVIKSFSTLSGLAQHLESGACGGGSATLRRVAEYVETKLSELGVGKLKLLK